MLGPSTSVMSAEEGLFALDLSRRPWSGICRYARSPELPEHRYSLLQRILGSCRVALDNFSTYGCNAMECMRTAMVADFQSLSLQ